MRKQVTGSTRDKIMGRSGKIHSNKKQNKQSWMVTTGEKDNWALPSKE